MFEDIILTPESKPDTITYDKACHNCENGSIILADQMGSRYCTVHQGNRDKNYYCVEWSNKQKHYAIVSFGI